MQVGISDEERAALIEFLREHIEGDDLMLRSLGP
jgi:hypothetical protein